jgi:hypothetical protein
MTYAKHIGGICALAVALGVGMAVASTPAIASAKPADKGTTHDSSSAGPSAKTASNATPKAQPKPHRKPKKHSDTTAATTTTTTRKLAVVNTPVAAHAAKPARKDNPVTQLVSMAVKTLTVPSSPRKATVTATPQASPAVVDPSFISSTHGFFGLFSVTSAADPADNNYVAFVLRTPFFTDVLTSGTDPENNLGLGNASLGVAGHTVNTFISPFGTFAASIPVTDPLAPLFTALVRAGF